MYDTRHLWSHRLSKSILMELCNTTTICTCQFTYFRDYGFDHTWYTTVPQWQRQEENWELKTILDRQNIRFTAKGPLPWWHSITELVTTVTQHKNLMLCNVVHSTGKDDLVNSKRFGNFTPRLNTLCLFKVFVLECRLTVNYHSSRSMVASPV